MFCEVRDVLLHRKRNFFADDVATRTIVVCVRHILSVKGGRDREVVRVSGMSNELSGTQVVKWFTATGRTYVFLP